MIVIITSYLVFGFLIIRWLVTCYNYFTKPLLPYFDQFSMAHNSVSLLIPARNEEKNIVNCIQNLRAIDTTDCVKEILILDDNSEDQTADRIRNQIPNLLKIKLISGLPLPKGWLGKNWACHQLALQAKGHYILFVDADVTLTKTAIENALEQCNANKLDLLSLFPNQKMVNFGEKLVVPLMHYLLLGLLPLRLVRSTKFASLAAANGQFMLFDAESYRKHNFHELIKNNVLDDVNIMRLVKSHGLRGEVLLANNQVFCRMYQSGKEAFAGFSKNLFPGFGSNILIFQLYFYLIFWGWFALILNGNIVLITICCALSLSIRTMISSLAQQSIWQNLVLHPLQICYYACIGIYSMYLHLTHNVSWKGRKI